MKNNKTILIIICIFLILLFTNFFMFNKITNMQKDFNQYETSIKALNDSLTVKIDGQTAIWSKLTPEIDINTLINSEYFKTLSNEQQQYYKEIQKIKGLIASTQAELQKQGEILEEINTLTYASIQQDSITFKRGQELTFNEKDTSKNLQWNSKIKLDSISEFSFNYDYKFDIQTNFIRNKDKSIKVEYKINDPDLKMNTNYSFIIPTEQKTKWQTFMDKNGKWLKPVGAAIIFGAGTYVGTQISK